MLERLQELQQTITRTNIYFRAKFPTLLNEVSDLEKAKFVESKVRGLCGAVSGGILTVFGSNASPQCCNETLAPSVGETDLLTSKNISLGLSQNCVTMMVFLLDNDKFERVFHTYSEFQNKWILNHTSDLGVMGPSNPQTWGYSGPPTVRQEKGKLFWHCLFCDTYWHGVKTPQGAIRGFEAHFKRDHKDIGIESLGVPPENVPPQQANLDAPETIPIVGQNVEVLLSPQQKASGQKVLVRKRPHQEQQQEFQQVDPTHLTSEAVYGGSSGIRASGNFFEQQYPSSSQSFQQHTHQMGIGISGTAGQASSSSLVLVPEVLTTPAQQRELQQMQQQQQFFFVSTVENPSAPPFLGGEREGGPHTHLQQAQPTTIMLLPSVESSFLDKNRQQQQHQIMPSVVLPQQFHSSSISAFPGWSPSAGATSSSSLSYQQHQQLLMPPPLEQAFGTFAGGLRPLMEQTTTSSLGLQSSPTAFDIAYVVEEKNEDDGNGEEDEAGSEKTKMTTEEDDEQNEPAAEDGELEEDVRFSDEEIEDESQE